MMKTVLVALACLVIFRSLRLPWPRLPSGCSWPCCEH